MLKALRKVDACICTYVAVFALSTVKSMTNLYISLVRSPFASTVIRLYTFALLDDNFIVPSVGVYVVALAKPEVPLFGPFATFASS